MTETTAGKSHKVAFYADIFYNSELSPAYWTPPANLDVDVILLGGDIHYDNPGEKLNRIDGPGPTYFGYPQCWAEGDLPGGGGGQA